MLVEGFKRDAFPKLEVHRAANGKPLLHPDDPHIVAIASDTPLPQAKVPVIDLDDIERIVDVLLKHAAPLGAAAAAHAERVMAQLTDDCFAFSGPLLPVADMERLIAERVAPVAETETVALAAARGRVLARDVAAPIDLPPFDNSAVDGYAVRHRRSRRRRPRRGSRSPAALTAGSAARAADRARARRSASSPARRCRPAPTPCSCRRTCASRATR